MDMVPPVPHSAYSLLPELLFPLSLGRQFHEGNQIRSFGDNGDFLAFLLFHAEGYGLSDTLNLVDSCDFSFLIIEPTGEELNTSHPHGFQLHFRLPLINIGHLFLF